ncbi:EI24 domain-containing protein [Nocardiopsis lucentensis]|uniref:EI24 domain-containing protein n=1 Tax=Nocardiopsis lucentensis TaxID=53441 RepID=UPI000344CE3B|nr:EI24 domain-containing protein [Nocardiopsis lucentensis]
MVNSLREILGGAGALARGFGMMVRSPRLFLLGALPPLFTSLVFLALFVTLLVNVGDLAAWATPFSEGWDPTWRNTLRVAVSVAMAIGAVLVMVVTFTTVTLTLGAPVYDKIGELVEERLGNPPEGSDEPLMASIVRAIRQSLGIILMSLLVTLVVFGIGFIPLVGQVVGAVLAAVLGGWLLAIELLAGAFDRRNMLLVRDRRRYMGTRRLRVLGYAVPTYFLLAIPFVAIAVFPAAAAGGTILARELFEAGERRGWNGPGGQPLTAHGPGLPGGPQAPGSHPLPGAPWPPHGQGHPPARG